MFKITTRTIVAIGIGAALFMLLFMYVKVPSPIPETSFMTAYGLGAFMATIFGPIAGGRPSYWSRIVGCYSVWLALVVLGVPAA